MQGFGGFPTPLTLGARLAKKVAPAAYRALERKLTIIPEARQVPLTPLPLEKAHISGPLPHRRPTAPPGNPTHVPERTDTSDWTDDLEALGEKMKSYVKQTAIWVGRNSFFHLEDLSDEELEEVGGVEFGAIRVLSWLVPAVRMYLAPRSRPSLTESQYIIGTNLICFIVWVSYLSSVHRYDTVFEAQPRRVPVSWYVLPRPIFTCFSPAGVLMLLFQVLRLPSGNKHAARSSLHD